MIYIPKYFSLRELTVTSVDVPNIPNFEQVWNLSLLCEKVLDPMRVMWKKPIHVNSGYRSPEVNKAIGGVQTSQHLSGMAADITAGDKESNRALFEMIIKSGLTFDQLIDEKGYAWLHISYKERDNRMQVLHLK